MEPTINTEETYTQRKLSELLDVATDKLLPGSGYKLSLQGVPATPLMHKELEAFFGTSLDAEAGADITLGYDELSGQMVLADFSFPIKGIDGVARLLRTETIGYIPAIIIRNQPFRSRNEYYSHKRGNDLLLGFGIDNIPSYDEVAYAQWRAKVLVASRGWHLKEALEIPLNLDIDSAQTITLQNEEAFDLASAKLLRKKSITRSIMLFNSDDDSTQHIEQTLESATDKDSHTMPMYTRTYKKSRDPIVINAEDVTDSEMKALRMDRNSYNDFKNSLEDIIAIRKNLKI